MAFGITPFHRFIFGVAVFLNTLWLALKQLPMSSNHIYRFFFCRKSVPKENSLLVIVGKIFVGNEVLHATKKSH